MSGSLHAAANTAATSASVARERTAMLTIDKDSFLLILRYTTALRRPVLASRHGKRRKSAVVGC
jgi:hypothetical protein